MRRLLSAALVVSLASGGVALAAGEQAASAISGTPRVISCYKAPDSTSIGVRFRSFANTGGSEVYLGRTDSGFANRAEQQLSWSQAALNSFSFTLDRAGDRLISQVGANAPLYYPSAAGGLAAELSAGALDGLNIAQITVAARDAGTIVSLQDVKVDSTPIDADPNTPGPQDFTATQGVSPEFRDWMLTGLDFADPAGWTITGKIALSGTFSSSQENSRVELMIGRKTDPTVSVQGDGTVTEGTNPTAAYKIVVDGTLYQDVTVDYTTVPGTATAPQDYTTTSGTFTVPACLNATPAINGGLSWTGWQNRGVSNQTGLWAGGSTTKPIEVYTTAFTFDAANNVITGSPIKDGRDFSRNSYTSYNSGSATLNNPTNRPVTAGGAFNDGNTIFGIGLRIVDNAAFEATSSNTNVNARLNARWGWSGWQYISFGRNEGSNTSFAPASTVGASDARTSFGYTRTGDFGGNVLAGGPFTAQEVPIAFKDGNKWTGLPNSTDAPNCNNFPNSTVRCFSGGAVGNNFAIRGFGQDNDATDVHTVQYFYDLTAMAKLYGRDDVSEDSLLDNFGWPDNQGIGGPVNLTRAQVKVATLDQEFTFGTMPEIRVPIVDDNLREPDQSFSFAISNPSGATLGSPTSVTTTIVDNDPNSPPVASPASASTPKNTAVAISPTVTDPESDPTTVSVVSAPSNGSVVVSGPGTFTYTPAPGFVGVDSFTYKANDGVFDSNVATITVTVTNGAPVASAASASTPEDIPVAISPTVTDPDGDATTVSVVSGPSNGSVIVSGPGTFTYTPGANFTGVDTFTYKANDGLADSNVATITVTVTAVAAALPDLRVSTVVPPRTPNPGVWPEGAPKTLNRTYTITRSGPAAALNRISTVQWQTNPSPKNPANGCASVPAINTVAPMCHYVTVAPTLVTFLPGETTKTVTVVVVGAGSVPKSGVNYRVELINPYKANIKKGVHTMKITRT